MLKATVTQPRGKCLLPINRTHAPHKRRKPAMDIKPPGSQPSTTGSPDYFTGAVRIDPLFETPPSPEPARIVAATVTFEPGARTAWHTHPLGQTLIITAGRGRAQRWGGPLEDL